MSLRSALLLSAVSAWLAGCSQEPSAPAAATLDVDLATAAHDDGAVLFTISGGPVDSVEALGHALYVARIDDNTTRIIVTGDLGAGPIARLHIGDERWLPQYTVTLNQVAARSYTQRDVASYGLTLSR